MKRIWKLTALAVSLALLLSLASCADFGAGEGEDDFKKYFSGVHVLSRDGLGKYPIGEFNKEINLEDMDIPVIVDYAEYCYIGFRVEKQYTLDISEFAFFARTEKGSGELELEFYVVDKMPTSIKDSDGNDVDLPTEDEEIPTEGQNTNALQGEEALNGGEGENETETETEVYEKDVFDPSKRFHTSTFSIGEEWSSVLLQFDGSRTVEEKQYIVVRINNNCYVDSSSEEEGEKIPAVSFTFNYLMFHITNAHKK